MERMKEQSQENATNTDYVFKIVMKLCNSGILVINVNFSITATCDLGWLIN